MKYSLSNSLLYILIFFFARGAGQYLKYNSTGWSGWQLSYLYIYIYLYYFWPYYYTDSVAPHRCMVAPHRCMIFYQSIRGPCFLDPPLCFLNPWPLSAVLPFCFCASLFVCLCFCFSAFCFCCFFACILLCFSAFVPFALLAFCFSCFFVLHASLLDLLLFFSASLLFCLCLSTSTSTIPPFLFISHAFLQFYFLYPHCKLIKLLYTGMIANW